VDVRTMSLWRESSRLGSRPPPFKWEAKRESTGRALLRRRLRRRRRRLERKRIAALLLPGSGRQLP
jgi:hypothetical protein